MKTTKKQSDDFLKNLVDQIEQDNTKAHQRITKTCVLPEARSYASKNLPAPDEDNLQTYLVSITGHYKALKKVVSLKMKGSLQQFFGSVNVAHLTEKIESVKTSIRNLGEIINHLVIDKGNIVINSNPNTYKKQRWLLFLFGLAESILNVSSFLHIGDILIFALIVGATIGFAQIFAAKTIVLSIREIQDIRKRKLYFKVAFIGFALFSLMLGTLRFYFAHTGAAAAVPFIILNPFCFAILNLVLVIASGSLTYFYHPSKTEMAEIEQLEQIEKQIDTASRQKKLLEEQQAELEEEKVQVHKITRQLKHDEQKLYEQVDSLFDVAVGSFKNENLCKRSDGHVPECFRHPHRIVPEPDMAFFAITT